MGNDAHLNKTYARREGADATARSRAGRAGRDGIKFVAIPYVVLSSPGWQRASHTARSLLLDMLNIRTKKNSENTYPNGRLICTTTAIKPMGWTGQGVFRRALRELIDCGLLIETRKGGHVKGREAWYAVTWLKLVHTTGLDINPNQFRTGGYMNPDGEASSKRSRDTRSATAARWPTGTSTAPSDGVTTPAICSVRRRKHIRSAPSDGAQTGVFGDATAPSDGDVLEKYHLSEGAGTKGEHPAAALSAALSVTAPRSAAVRSESARKVRHG
jgi:hypothetical protein